MKKITGIILTASLIISSSITCFATEKEVSGQENPSYKVIIEREDVSHEEALKSPTYNEKMANNSDNYSDRLRGIHWEVWGDSEWKTVNNVYGAVPIGYSKRVDDFGVEYNTYHYTRTYLDAIMKIGDSGQVWGNWTVKATGKFCDKGVWDSHTHYVKYGTEN